MRSCFLWGRKITAATLAAAILLSGSGPANVAFAQSVNTNGLGGSIRGAGGVQVGALRLSALQTPVSPSTINGILPRTVEGPTAPASALSPVQSLLPLESMRQAATSKRRANGRLSRTPASNAGATALSAEVSDSDAKSFAAAEFSRLSGEEAPRVSGTVSDPAASPVSAAPAASAKTSSWKRRVGLSVAAVVGAGAGALTPVVPRAADAIAALPSASAAFAFLGDAGNWIGNGLSFALPVPEILKAITVGRTGAPAWRTGVMVAANLALGLVSAPVAGMWLWSVQNIAGAAAMLLIGPAMRWSGKIPGDSRTQAVWGTAAVAVISLAIGGALYFAAAAVVPGALTAWLGAAALGKVLVGIQVATGAAYFLLFLPDILSIMRGEAPHGYTPGFSLAFMLSSLSFLVWSGQLAWVAEAGSAERAKWATSAVLNFAYFIVSGISWWMARRDGKTPADKRSNVSAPASRILFH